MKKCNKLKKKFYLGAFCFFLIGLFNVIGQSIVNMSEVLDFGTGVVLLTILFVLGLYLMLPYVKCVSDYNKGIY